MLSEQVITKRIETLSEEKINLNSIEAFRAYEGKLLFTSNHFDMTSEAIKGFCTSVGNNEWIHWDDDRCAETPHLGAIVMPSFMAPSLLSQLFFEKAEIDWNKLGGLFRGVDNYRLHAPVRADDKLYLKMNIEKIEEKRKGIAVHYGLEYFVAGRDEKPCQTGTFIIRYWEL